MKRHVRRMMAMMIAAVCMLGTPMMAKATDVGETSTRTLSPDNSLDSLSISGAELSPAFYYSTVNYTATVSYDVTDVTVTAKTSNRNAAIESISGYENLSVGENTIKIVVVAENGNKATYTVKLTRLAEGEAPATDGSNAADDTANGDDAADDTANGDDAAAGDDTTDGDTTDDGTTDGADAAEITLPVGNTYFVPMDAPAEAVPDDMVQIDLDLEGIGTLHAYQYVQGTVNSALDELDFYFVYGTDADGTAGWYQYDRRNGAFQRYNERVREVVQTEDNSALLNNYNLASTQVKQLQQKIRLMACVFLFIVVVLLIIIFSILWSRRNDAYDDGDVFEDEPEPKPKKLHKKHIEVEEEPQEAPVTAEPEETFEKEEPLDLNIGVPDTLEEENDREADEEAEKTPEKKKKRRGSLLAYLGLDDDLPLDFGDVIEEDDEEEPEEEAGEVPVKEAKPETKKSVFPSHNKQKEDSNKENDIEFIDL